MGEETTKTTRTKALSSQEHLQLFWTNYAISPRKYNRDNISGLHSRNILHLEAKLLKWVIVENVAIADVASDTALREFSALYESGKGSVCALQPGTTMNGTHREN